MCETGCGKTSLVKFLCAVLGVTLFTFDVHGGYTMVMINEKPFLVCFVLANTASKIFTSH